MKTILLAIVTFFIFSAPGTAQPYKSVFGDQTTSWVYISHDQWGHYNDTVRIEKDTIINGKTYKKLSPLYPPSVYREDLNNGTVWCRALLYSGHPDDTIDRVISRMDLNVGDTFDIANIRLHKAGPDIDYPSVVDSVRYLNGLKHIYFKKIYEYYNEPYTLIEGIGSNMGILWKYVIYLSSLDASGYYLLCSYKDGQKTEYENRAFNGSCWQYSDIPIETAKEKNELIIYPLPAHDRVYFKNNSFPILSVLLMNTIGQVVKKENGTAIKELILEGIPPGDYFLHFSLSDGSKQTGLISKQ